MVIKTVLGLVVFFATNSAVAGLCSWCVTSKNVYREEIVQLAALEPKAQLASVRKKGICVKVMDSGRALPKDFFSWASIEAPEAKLTQVTQIKNVMGKTLCKTEHAVSKTCTTIVLASDAPRSTLLHEFLHVRQLENDLDWCPLSKKLWSKKPTAAEVKIIRDKEWDVHKLLWQTREKLNLGIEDKIAIVSETIDEAEHRQSYDTAAVQYVLDEKMPQYLHSATEEYKKLLQAK